MYTVNLLQLHKLLLQQDPHEIVKCDMDNFSSYTYIQKTDKMKELYDKLSDEEQIDYDEIEYELLNYLQYGGNKTPKQLIKEIDKMIDHQIDKVILK